jgi:hypothetical protein
VEDVRRALNLSSLLAVASLGAGCRTDPDDMSWLYLAEGDFARISLQLPRECSTEDRARLVEILGRDFGVPVLQPERGRYVVKLRAPREVDFTALCDLTEELAGRGLRPWNQQFDAVGTARDGRFALLGSGQTFALEGDPEATITSAFWCDGERGVVLFGGD